MGISAGRKTPQMELVELKHGIKLEDALPNMLNDYGLTGTADRLGIAKQTLGYWLLKLGINVRRVALRPGERIEIRRD